MLKDEFIIEEKRNRIAVDLRIIIEPEFDRITADRYFCGEYLLAIHKFFFYRCGFTGSVYFTTGFTSSRGVSIFEQVVQWVFDDLQPGQWVSLQQLFLRVLPFQGVAVKPVQHYR